MKNKRPIRIDPELLKSIKLFCVKNDRTITSFAEQWLVAGLEEESKVIK